MNYPIMPSSDKMKAGRGKYPWSELAVGCSFPVPIGEATESTLTSLAYRTGKRLNRRFKVVRHDDRGVFEVGRLADPVEDKENPPSAPMLTIKPVSFTPDNPRANTPLPTWNGMTLEQAIKKGEEE